MPTGSQDKTAAFQPRRLTDLLCSPAYLLMALLVFFPLFEVSCDAGPGAPRASVGFHGLSMTGGAVGPYTTGLGEKDRNNIRESLRKPWEEQRGDTDRTDRIWRLLKSYDWPIAIVPIVGFAFALRYLRLSKSRATSWQTVHGGAFTFAVTLMLLYYALFGFQLESGVRADLTRGDARGMPVTIEKTMWFWLMLILSIATTASFWFRKRSPIITSESGRLALRPASVLQTSQSSTVNHHKETNT
jgi:hypothetical protein